MSALTDLLSGAGATLDTPGAAVRNALAGRNPFQPLSNPFGWEGRVTGRDLLAQYGLAGDEPTGANMADGFLAEVATDPLTWTGAGALSRALGMGAKGARAAGAVSRAGQAASRTVAPAARAAAPAARAIPGIRPATAFSIATPALGSYMLGDNMSVPPEEQEAWKNWLGAGLMAAALAMAAGRGAKKLSDLVRKQPMLPGMEAPAAAAMSTGANPATAAKGAVPTAPDQIGDAILSLLKQGLTTADVAAELNRQGITNRLGKPWNFRTPDIPPRNLGLTRIRLNWPFKKNERF